MTPAAALDPRSRIVALALFTIAVCVVFDPAVLAGLTVAAFLALIPSGLTWRGAARRLAPVNAFMLLLWLTMPLLAGRAGAEQALAITLKANAIVAAAGACLSPIEPGTLAAGLHRLGVPTKLVWLLLLCHRYVAGLAGKVRLAATAIRLRSGKGGRLRFRAYGGLFAKLFVSGHESGDRLYLAMRARGYDACFALRRSLCWRRRDSLLVALTALLSLSAIFLGRLP